MIYSNTKLIYALPVLMLGLASCSPEKATKDVYKVAPPMIHQAKGSRNLLTWNQLEQKKLDLHDQIDFSKAKPASIKMVSNCLKENNELTREERIFSKGLISVFEMVPKEILSKNLKKGLLLCSFEIIAKNATGSQHIINVPMIPIDDSREAAVRLDNLPERISLENVAQIKMRVHHKGGAQAELFCEDVKLYPIPINQVADMSNFDFNRPILHSNKNPNILAERPLQRCRILIQPQDGKQQISHLLQIQFSRSELDITAMELPFRKWSPQAVNAWKVFAHGKPLKFSSHKIVNPTGAPRWIRINKNNLALQIWGAYANRTSFGATRNWATPHVDSLNKAELSSDKDHLIVKMEGLGEFVLHTLVVKPERCYQLNAPQFANLQIPEPVVVQEFNEAGEWLNSIQVPVTEPMTMLMQDGQHRFGALAQTPYKAENFYHCN